MGAQVFRAVKTIAGLSRSFRRHVHAEVSVTQVWAGADLVDASGVAHPGLVPADRMKPKIEGKSPGETEPRKP